MLFILMKAYQHPQRIHANGACSLVWFGGELLFVGRIRTTQLRVQKLDSLVAFKRCLPTIRYLSRKGVIIMFSLVVVVASPIGGIGYPNGKGL
jgi:hypothetical protein